jgi:hypothetical protein
MSVRYQIWTDLKVCTSGGTAAQQSTLSCVQLKRAQEVDATLVRKILIL